MAAPGHISGKGERWHRHHRAPEASVAKCPLWIVAVVDLAFACTGRT
jgi:hypothetical protein